MIGLVLGIGFVSTAFAPKDTTDDPAFKLMGQLVGSHWHGELGKMAVDFDFKYLEDGKMIEGTGGLTQDGKSVLKMDSKYGWDPVAKQTFYLDCHGHDTVYNGHVTLKGDTLVIDFVGLYGDKGHWVSYAKFPTADRYEFDMFEYKGGKLVPTHLGIKLHRVK